MNYMEEFDRWLDGLLRGLQPAKDIEAAKRDIEEKVLESYRNGLKAGRSPRKRDKNA
jgi:hypothetical protein